jgi:predicted AAA+ superfamily ATPase
MNPVLEESLKKRRVVVISGPRQCGKTTLSKQIMDNDMIYRTLDDQTMLSAAFEDPISFVTHNAKTLIIDEIQKCPFLITAIKQIVDTDTRSGRFLLTGSSDITANPAVSESLAGRIKNLRLRTMTIGETNGASPRFLEMVFACEFPEQVKGYNKYEIMKLAFRGGYPEVLNLTANDSKEWHMDYVNTLITKDLKDISNIRRQDALNDLLSILASWSSKLMDATSIYARLSIAKRTFDTYANLLQNLYLFEKLNPWIKTDYDCVGKRKKIFMTDTGLMSSLLHWKIDDVMFDPDKSGKLFETLVFHELSALIGISSGYEMYHYRDRENHEIDFVLENESRDLVGIEVKSGSIVSGDDFKHMRWFKEKIAKDRKFIGIILYSGGNTVKFGGVFYAVPVGALL